MIVDPDRYLKNFCDAGANILTVQYEACTHLQRTVTEIRKLGMKAGVAVKSAYSGFPSRKYSSLY